MSDAAPAMLATDTVRLNTPAAGRAALGKRLLTAAALIPAFVALVLGAPPWGFALLVVVVAGVAAWELARLFERAGRASDPRLVCVAAVAVTASFLRPALVGPALTVAVIALFSTVLVRAARLPAGQRPSAEPVVLGLLAVVYIAWFLGHAVLLRALPEGAGLILTLAGVTWAGETAAYAVGSSLGRYRLAPAVSPAKTLEGAAAQWLVSAAAAPLLAAWLLPEWSMMRAVGAGVLLGAVGQLGDLAESVIKRSVGVKDASDLIPGHGGLLDRVDGLLFNVPVLFYYTMWTLPRS